MDDPCSALETTTGGGGQRTEWYISMLKTFMPPDDRPNSPNSGLKKANSNGCGLSPEPDRTATQVLRRLENCLRTKSDEWVFDFLSTEGTGRKYGLAVLVQFLNFRLLNEQNNNNNHSNKWQQHQLGPVGEGVHLCLLCLKAIMERQFGFKQVVKTVEVSSGGQIASSSPALNAIALSFAHPSVVQRAKSLALDLLATTCLVGGAGEYHPLVLAAFDHVQRKMGERRRFQTLAACFIHNHLGPAALSDNHHLSVAALQCINILVNGSPNIALRIRLQAEFRRLGLEEASLRERLQRCSSAELAGHLQSYLGNLVNAVQLLAERELEVAQAKAANSRAQFAWTEAEKRRKNGSVSERQKREARELGVQALEAQAAYITALARLKRVEQALEESSS